MTFAFLDPRRVPKLGPRPVSRFSGSISRKSGEIVFAAQVVKCRKFAQISLSPHQPRKWMPSLLSIFKLCLWNPKQTKLFCRVDKYPRRRPHFETRCVLYANAKLGERNRVKQGTAMNIHVSYIAVTRERGTNLTNFWQVVRGKKSVTKVVKYFFSCFAFLSQSVFHMFNVFHIYQKWIRNIGDRSGL